MLVLSGGQCPP